MQKLISIVSLLLIGIALYFGITFIQTGAKVKKVLNQWQLNGVPDNSPTVYYAKASILFFFAIGLLYFMYRAYSPY